MAPSTAASLRILRLPSSSLHTLSLYPYGVLLVLTAAITLGTIPGVDAYSWNFRSPAQQCSNLTIDITGDDGTPPFRLLVVPFGPTPLANGTEARKIAEQVFTDKSGSFQLKYPANSQFVAVVSLNNSNLFPLQTVLFGCVIWFYL